MPSIPGLWPLRSMPHVDMPRVRTLYQALAFIDRDNR